ncbi:MAG: NAD-binding protein [Nitrospirota bacterium]
MRIVILGSGRVGSHVANDLVGKGHTIVIIDENERKFKNIIDNTAVSCIHGNIFDDTIFVKAFSEKTDFFVVVTGNDNINLMAAQFIQKKYNIKEVIIRIFDYELADVYKKDFGLSVICPTRYAISELTHLLEKGI